MRSCEEGMMGAGHSGHGVDLVYLYEPNCWFPKWAPVSKVGLGVVQQLVAELSHVVGIIVRDKLGNLREGDATAGLN